MAENLSCGEDVLVFLMSLMGLRKVVVVGHEAELVEAMVGEQAQMAFAS